MNVNSHLPPQWLTFLQFWGTKERCACLGMKGWETGQRNSFNFSSRPLTVLDGRNGHLWVILNMPQTMDRINLTHGKASQDSKNVKIFGFWGQNIGKDNYFTLFKTCNRPVLVKRRATLGLVSTLNMITFFLPIHRLMLLISSCFLIKWLVLLASSIF